MANSNATFGKGTLLQYGDENTATNFVTLTECRVITPSPPTRDTHDVTNHDSTGDYEELIGGLIRTGSVQVQLNGLPADTKHQQLWTDFGANTIRYWQIVYPDTAGTIFRFKGFVETAPFPTGDSNAPLQSECSLKITGEITII